MKQGQIVLVNNPKKLQFSHIYTENVLVTVYTTRLQFLFCKYEAVGRNL